MDYYYKKQSTDKAYFNQILFLVLMVPPINSIATVTTNFFPPSTINPGSIRFFFLFVLLLFFYVKYYINTQENSRILLFTIYLLFLGFLSANISETFSRFPKAIMPMLFFPVGFYLFRNIESLRKLNFSFLISNLIFIMSFLAANLFGFGDRGYGGETEGVLYFGTAGVNLAKPIVLLLLLVPFYLKITTNTLMKYFILAVSVLSIIIILLAVKRAAFLALGMGILGYLIFTPRKGRFIKTMAIASALLFVLSPFFADKFFEGLQVRETQFDFASPEFNEKEARFDEFEIVKRKFIEGSLKHKLFGTDLFYDTYLFPDRRNIHVDYFAMLYGAGIIGLFWFVYIYWAILKGYLKFNSKEMLFYEGRATVLALILASLGISIAGSIYDVNLRTIFFLYTGAMVGWAKYTLLDKTIKRKLEPEESNLLNK